jgi:hypothetical protein
MFALAKGLRQGNILDLTLGPGRHDPTHVAATTGSRARRYVTIKVRSSPSATTDTPKKYPHFCWLRVDAPVHAYTVGVSAPKVLEP